MPSFNKPIEQQFRLLVESVTEYAIFLLDPTGHIVSWNNGAQRIKGYTPDEILGKHFSIFYTDEDLASDKPGYELKHAAAHGRYEEEGWRLRKDGSLFWANVLITALFDPPGVLSGYAKVTRDFTERRAAEERLQRSEERFRLLVGGVRDYAIFMLSPSGRIESWNEGAQRIKQYTASEIIGQHFSRFYEPEDVALGKPEHELEVAQSEGQFEDEGWRVRKDGSRFWANVIITALHNDSGELYGFAKITRDITDRKAAQDVHIQVMRDQISRTFLRDILYSVTEGRLHYCEDSRELPDSHSCVSEDLPMTAHTLAQVRSGVRKAGAALGFAEQRIIDLVTGVSEAAMNAVLHASDATYSICASDSMLQIWIKDNGGGIAISHLHRATLERGFTTGGTLGHGFWLMLQTCDRLWLMSTPQGTTVVLEQDREPHEPDWLAEPRQSAVPTTQRAADV